MSRYNRIHLIFTYNIFIPPLQVTSRRKHSNVVCMPDCILKASEHDLLQPLVGILPSLHWGSVANNDELLRCWGRKVKVEVTVGYGQIEHYERISYELLAGISSNLKLRCSRGQRWTNESLKAKVKGQGHDENRLDKNNVQKWNFPAKAIENHI